MWIVRYINIQQMSYVGFNVVKQVENDNNENEVTMKIYIFTKILKNKIKRVMQ